jgi:hypothetical protein
MFQEIDKSKISVIILPYTRHLFAVNTQFWSQVHVPIGVNEIQTRNSPLMGRSNDSYRAKRPS